VDAAAQQQSEARLRGDPYSRTAELIRGATRPWGQGATVTVASLLPRLKHMDGRVVQVLHPWPTDPPLAWAEVAARSGLELQQLWPVAQPFPDEFAAEAVAVTTGAQPHPGYVRDRGLAAALVEVLQAATTTPDRVRFLLWRGWGHVDYGRWPDAAEVELEQRPCVLLRGAVDGLTEDLAPDAGGHYGAQLCWPADHTWAMATEVDLPFTLVAGQGRVIEMLLAHPRLETVLTTWTAPAGRVG
jgi:hypothetical protein